jgi:UDP-N-acetylmuramyl pentapeptide phosphotransferase/UDP-N-acetylglucosamine-1-phosphate transferase
MPSIPLLKYFAIFSLSTVIVILLTPLFIKFAPRLGLIDVPDERCVHKKIMPLGGGLVVFIAFNISCYAIYHYFWFGFSSLLNITWWQAFFIASAILLIVGLIDDRFGMSPLMKLIGQATACATLYFLSGYSVSLLDVDFGFWGGLVFVLIWTLAIVNAFNLIDGLDGLCSGLAMISAIGLAAMFIFRHSVGDALVCLALVGACAGFLYYNFFPAKVFLGDTGSMFLGFTLASISLHAGGKGSFAVILAAPFFIAGIPIIDTLLAIWRRSIRKTLAKRHGLPAVGVMQPDKDHLHHRLLNSGLTQRKTTLTLYVVNIFIVCIGLLFMIFKERATGMFLIILLITIYILIKYVFHIELWETHKLIASPNEIQNFTRVSALYYCLFDLLWMAMAVWLTEFITLSGTTYFGSIGQWFSQLPLWETPVFLLLFASNTYVKVWKSSVFKDYLFLLIAILVGSIVSLSLLIPSNVDNNLLLINRTLLFFLLSSIGIVSIRVVHHLIREFTINNANTRNIIVYGAGANGDLYLHKCYLKNASKLGSVNIIGFIDDNLLLKNKYVYGKKIFGGLSELTELISKYPIDEVVITTEISNEIFFQLKEIINNNSIKIIKWYTVFV